jgi:tRNA pseudouridine55 synthase
LSDRFLNQDKEYLAEVKLGESTDTYDCDGVVQNRSDQIPTLEAIEQVVSTFQGEIDQVPPMFSAKKIQGKKLYELARQGKTVERASVRVKVDIQIVNYVYPYLTIKVACSKGTYVRSLAHEIGEKLGCWAHLSALERLRSGPFRIEDCVTLEALESPEFDLCQSRAFTKEISTTPASGKVSGPATL